MGTKLMYVLFLALATNLSSSSVAGALPVIDILNAVSDRNAPQISISIRAGRILKASTELSAGQKYKLKIDDINKAYYAIAEYGLKFASFNAYDPARDKGKSTIYWRANNSGFDISYDRRLWKRLSPWVSE